MAALADKQSTGLFGPTDKLLCNFLPISNPTILIKQKGRALKAHPLCLGVIDEKDTKLKADELKQKRMTFCTRGCNFNECVQEPSKLHDKLEFTSVSYFCQTSLYKLALIHLR